MQAITFVVLAILVIKVIDFFKQVQNRQWNAVVTQVVVWVAGFVVLLIAAQTQFAHGLAIPPAAMPLDKLGVWDLVFTGLVLGSGGSVGWQAVANLGGGNHEVDTPLVPSLKRPPTP